MANLKNNTTTMQEILDAVNALPEAGSGGVDVSGVTASPDDVMEGKIIVDANGNEQVGTIPEITAQNVIITPKNEETKRYTIPAGRHDGTGSVRIITRSKTVTPSTEKQTITADSGYTLESVTVDGDSNLIAGNIKSGVSIFGVTGTFEGSSSNSGFYTSSTGEGSSLTFKLGTNKLPSKFAIVLTDNWSSKSNVITSMRGSFDGVESYDITIYYDSGGYQTASINSYDYTTSGMESAETAYMTITYVMEDHTGTYTFDNDDYYDIMTIYD